MPLNNINPFTKDVILISVIEIQKDVSIQEVLEDQKNALSKPDRKVSNMLVYRMAMNAGPVTHMGSMEREMTKNAISNADTTQTTNAEQATETVSGKYLAKIETEHELYYCLDI